MFIFLCLPAPSVSSIFTSLSKTNLPDEFFTSFPKTTLLNELEASHEEKAAAAAGAVAAAAMRADPFVGVGVDDGGVETDRRCLAEGLGGGKRKVRPVWCLCHVLAPGLCVCVVHRPRYQAEQ